MDKVVHFEVPADDVSRAKKFYSEYFGWQMQDIPEMNEPIIARTPMKRWGLPADMAGAVLFLCSEQAAFVTGQTLIIDGGYTLGV